MAISVDIEEPEGCPYLSVDGLDYFLQHWLPILKELGLTHMCEWNYGSTWNETHVPVFIDELKVFLAYLEAHKDNPPERYERMVYCSKAILRVFEEIKGQPASILIG